MRVEVISQLSDPRLDDFTSLTDVGLRSRVEPENGLYLAESPKVIARSLAAGHAPRSVLTLRKWLSSLETLLVDYPDVPVFVGSDQQLESITGFNMHRGAIASVARPKQPSLHETLEGARLVVVLEDIVDHTNVGAAFRSAAALGADAVLVTPRCADPYYRRSVRVSMGTVLQVPWTRLADWPASIAELQSLGFVVAALTLSDDAVDLADFARSRPERLALVLGTEGDGIRRRTARRTDLHIRIPMMHGVDSLNVAAASAVALYALTNSSTTGRAGVYES